MHVTTAVQLTRDTTGEPARLRLTADRPTVRADGQDLSFLTVEARDARSPQCLRRRRAARSG
jgi:beta-galactosidase